MKTLIFRTYAVTCHRCIKDQLLKTPETLAEAKRLLQATGWRQEADGWICDKCLTRRKFDRIPGLMKNAGLAE